MARFLDVGLTGGIATGKSLASSIFEALGAAIIDADKVYHELIQPGEKLYKKIVKAFGEQILDEDGAIDRKKLSSEVFSDEAKRERLNMLAHPAVIKERKRRRKEIEKAWKKEKIDQGVIITEAALMVEAETYKNFDALIVVSCTPELQKQRLMERDGISEAEANSKIASQMPISEKEEYADFLIRNEGTTQDLIRAVEAVYHQLCEKAAG